MMHIHVIIINVVNRRSLIFQVPPCLPIAQRNTVTIKLYNNHRRLKKILEGCSVERAFIKFTFVKKRSIEMTSLQLTFTENHRIEERVIESTFTQIDISKY